MPKVLLVIATVIDLALAALMIGVSGFIFGSGPESVHGGNLLAVAYGAAVIACLALPVAGFIFNARGKAGLGLLHAWLPPIAALIVMAIPAPY